MVIDRVNDSKQLTSASLKSQTASKLLVPDKIQASLDKFVLGACALVDKANKQLQAGAIYFFLHCGNRMVEKRAQKIKDKIQLAPPQIEDTSAPSKSPAAASEDGQQQAHPFESIIA